MTGMVCDDEHRCEVCVGEVTARAAVSAATWLSPVNRRVVWAIVWHRVIAGLSEKGTVPAVATQDQRRSLTFTLAG